MKNVKILDNDNCVYEISITGSTADGHNTYSKSMYRLGIKVST